MSGDKAKWRTFVFNYSPRFNAAGVDKFFIEKESLTVNQKNTAAKKDWYLGFDTFMYRNFTISSYYVKKINDKIVILHTCDSEESKIYRSLKNNEMFKKYLNKQEKFESIKNKLTQITPGELSKNPNIYGMIAIIEESILLFAQKEFGKEFEILPIYFDLKATDNPETLGWFLYDEISIVGKNNSVNQFGFYLDGTHPKNVFSLCVMYEEKLKKMAYPKIIKFALNGQAKLYSQERRNVANAIPLPQ